ncbi:MAG: TIGR01777 family protein [Gammaproteobacteria bacterium]|uniref:Epimerase family protein n=1 Tax=Marinobacter litoralis TaxID=187981 RepID=A0A3M2R9M3_9GAMM|nr:TIGR01777 family oxidoreductase [Marinobacter litoralis]MBR9869583.1 TIGR01777 family protein [Gammaproteobacteria bacterium]RMJ01988.1 Epimerase family protein [Marinobacter litoralis]
MPKKILITGGTGFIGRELCKQLLKAGHTLTVLSRQKPATVKSICGKVEPVSDLNYLKSHPGFDAVFNLAGEGIADKRWTAERKATLLDSRVALTLALIDVVRSWEELPQVLISGSAVGFYGDQGNHLVTEDTAPNPEFTHRLCAEWEDAARTLQADAVRVCLSRTGLVVGKGGGFLERMTLPFKFGLGGKLGSGEQYMPWVHRTDVVAGLIWMLDNHLAQGAYNMVSPNPVTNVEFTRAFAHVLKRPALLPVPARALRMLLGEMSGLLLTGQKAIPARLQSEGFKFSHPVLEEALNISIKK